MENKFSQNLKSYRIAMSLTQSRLAEMLGTTQRKVSYWENGDVEPDIEMLCCIADFFEVTMDELVGREYK